MKLHHVSWCLEPEHVDEAKQLWQVHLGVKLLDFAPPELGLRVLLAWDEGVEIIAPHGTGGSAGPMVRAFLDQRGEGVYSAVYQVDDLAVAVEQARESGGVVLFEEDVVFGEGASAVRITQAMLDDLCGMRLTLQQITPLG